MKQVQQLVDDLANIYEAVDGAKPPPRRHRGEKPIDFAVGDFVCTAATVGVDKSTRVKTSPIWYGPAVIVGKVNDYVYVVKDINSDRERELHASHIKFYADRGTTITPQMREFASYGGTGYAIESVVDHDRRSDGTVRLLVKWELSPNPTWESLPHMFADAPKLVHAYARHIQKPAERAALQAIISALRH